MARFTWMCLFTLLLALCAAAHADEIEERNAVKTAAFTAFANGDFPRLDALASEYRDKASRFPSGVWKLSFFYLGISDRAPSGQPDAIAWRQLREETAQWVSAYPQSSTAILVHGIVLENEAWSFRLDDDNGRVSPAQIEAYKATMAQARDFLEEHKAVGAQDPHWYVSMVRVATALRLPKDVIMALVQESSQRKPYYYQTYFAAVDYFSPKWGGNAQSLEEFVRAVVAQTRDEEGLALYARIYWAALQSWYAKTIWPALNWPDFRRGVHDVLKKYPDQWNLNSFARFSCVAQDMALASDLFAQISTPDLAVWGRREDFNTCRDWSRTGSSKAGERGL